jgi:hypothetical protein
MEVIGQRHAPAALPQEKEPPVPIEKEAGWVPRAGLDAVTKRKNLSSVVQPVFLSLYWVSYPTHVRNKKRPLFREFSVSGKKIIT